MAILLMKFWMQQYVGGGEVSILLMVRAAYWENHQTKSWFVNDIALAD